MMPILICVCNSITYWDKIDTIFNIIGVLVTATAVIVALYANHKATEQLQKTIEMQEQAKNVELFDKRVNLIEAVQSGKTVSELELRLLFNGDVVNKYGEWRKFVEEERPSFEDLEWFAMMANGKDEAVISDMPHSKNEPRLYRRSDLEANYNMFHKQTEICKNTLTQIMEKFVSDSITPLNGK